MKIVKARSLKTRLDKCGEMNRLLERRSKVEEKLTTLLKCLLKLALNLKKKSCLVWGRRWAWNP